MPARSIVYVDGFNLYYGTLRNTAWKWLNLQVLFERLRQDDDIQAIYYFTARASGDSGARQQVYFGVLRTLSKLRIVFGRFKRTIRHCGVKECTYQGRREFGVQVEKRTDVNIAVQMLDDAYQDRADRLILVSGDSDLVPALISIKEHFPLKKLIVYVPASDEVRGAATEIRQAADKHATLPVGLLKHCLFPPRLPNGQGGWLSKPASW